MSPTSYRCSTSRCLDGKDRRLLLLDQVYWGGSGISAERVIRGLWRVLLALWLAQNGGADLNYKFSTISILVMS